MKVSLKRAAIAALVGGFVAAGPALAQDPTPAPGQHHGSRHANPEARMEHMVTRMFSSVDASDQQKARQAGFDAHVVKPGDLQVLTRLLSQGRVR